MTGTVARRRIAPGAVSGLAVATAISRLTGFLRTSVWAAALGLYSVGSAFTIANTIPTVLFTLLAGGMLSAVLVPQLVRAFTRSDAEGCAYADRLLTLIIVVLTPLTIAAVLGAPVLARLYAGIGWSDADLALAATFTGWCLPQIPLYGLFSVLGQILHARDRPGPMTWAPVVNNVVTTAVGLCFLWYGGIDVGVGPDASASVSGLEAAVLGGGATFGVAAQVAVLLPALRSAGIRYRPRWDFRDAALRRTARLAGWSIVFVAANQVAFLVTAAVANTAGKAAERPGAWAAGLPSYTNANMLMLVPHAIVAVSISATAMPAMSRSAARGDLSAVAALLDGQLSRAGRLLLPIAAWLAATGPLVTRLVLPGNPETDTWYVGIVLIAFSPAVVLYSAQFLTARTLQALEDNRTSALVQTAIAGIQGATAIAALLLLPPGWVVAAAAGGFSLAYGLGLGLGLQAVRHQTGGPHLGDVATRQGPHLMGVIPAAVAAHLVAVFGTADTWLTAAVTATGSATVFCLVHSGVLLMLRRQGRTRS